MLRRNYSRKKHWPIKFSVQYPGQEAPLELELSSSAKIKTVKQIVAEKLGNDLNADQVQLTVEGGEVLKKSGSSLDNYGIKNGDILIFE